MTNSIDKDIRTSGSEGELFTMTDQEVEMRFMEMSKKNAPDIWDKIEKKLDSAAANSSEQAELSENAKITGIKRDKAKDRRNKRKIGAFLFGGSSFRAAAAIFVICMLGMGAVGGARGILLSSKSVDSADSYSYEEGAYKSSGATAPGTANEAAMEYKTEAVAEDAYAPDMDMAVDEGSAEQAAGAASAEDLSAAANQKSGRKLIRSIDITAETKEFDDFIAFVKGEIVKKGGYIEGSSISGSSYRGSSSAGRFANFTLRVPADQTDSLIEILSGKCNVTNIGETTRDITLSYVDTQSRVTALREEQEQLLKMIEKAETMEEIIAIRSQLSEIRYELEYHESQLKSYDNLTDYDSIYLNISEVKQVTPVQERSVIQRMGDGFMDSLAAAGEGIVEFAVWAVSNIPYFIILFLVIFIIVLIVKKIRRNRNNTP